MVRERLQCSRFACFVWGLCLATQGRAQLLDDRQLAFAREAKTIQFAETELNRLSPYWQIEPLVISARDAEAAVVTMTKYAERIVTEHTLLYDLSAEQQSKLKAAAQLDARQFMRHLHGKEIIVPAELIRARQQAVKLGVEFRVNCNLTQDLLGEGSFFAKMHQQLVTAEQLDYSKRQLNALRKDWIDRSSSDELMDWLGQQTQLSTGQRARLSSLLHLPLKSSTQSAAEFLKQLQSLPREKLAAVLSEKQCAEIEKLMQGYQE